MENLNLELENVKEIRKSMSESDRDFYDFKIFEKCQDVLSKGHMLKEDCNKVYDIMKEVYEGYRNIISKPSTH